MPKALKANPPNKTERLTRLADVKPGEIFRFQSVTFEQAIAGGEVAVFFKVIEVQPKKNGRVTIASIDGRSFQEKDDDHMVVVVHPSTLMIGEADFVQPPL